MENGKWASLFCLKANKRNKANLKHLLEISQKSTESQLAYLRNEHKLK